MGRPSAALSTIVSPNSPPFSIGAFQSVPVPGGRGELVQASAPTPVSLPSNTLLGHYPKLRGNPTRRELRPSNSTFSDGREVVFRFTRSICQNGETATIPRRRPRWSSRRPPSTAPACRRGRGLLPSPTAPGECWRWRCSRRGPRSGRSGRTPRRCVWPRP